MKTRTSSKNQTAGSAFQAKAKNQTNDASILQAYKNRTAQLAVEEEPAQSRENKTGLPDNLKSGVENLSGHSMDDVKVHYNSSQPAALHAHAYAQGTDIHVGPGQEKHLPHEAWHVVQQKEGRVQPTKQLKGTTNINDDAGLEKEADVMGAKALTTQSSSSAALQLKAVFPSSQAIQLHRGANEYDTAKDDMIIYIVVKKSNDKVVYVGQTELAVGKNTRFQQHINSGYHNNWSHDTHKILTKESGRWTRFETTCCEQYWIDHYGIDNLENGRHQISKSHFEEMIEWQEDNDIVFRGEDIGFPKNWKPLN
jgi:hypothetical protein